MGGLRPRSDHDHQPPQRAPEGHPQAQPAPPGARDGAAGSWPRARTCSPPPTPRAGSRSSATARPAAACPGPRWSPSCWRRPRSWARARGRWPSMRSGGAKRPSGRCACPCTASTTPATSARSCAALEAFGASSVAIGPGTADPYGPKAVRASMGAIFAIRLARVHDIAQLPHRRVALVAEQGAGAPLHTLALDGVTVMVGGERDGLPEAVVRGGRPRRPHPDRHPLAQRRDGGDGGAL